MVEMWRAEGKQLLDIRQEVEGRREFTDEAMEIPIAMSLATGMMDHIRVAYDLLRASGSDGTELLRHIHWLPRWAMYGFPTFDLTHSLASALLLTDCRRMRVEDAPWPFPSFLIRLPYPDSPITIGGPDGKRVPAWCLEVHTYGHADERDYDRFNLALYSKAQGQFCQMPCDATWKELRVAVERLGRSIPHRPFSVVTAHSIEDLALFRFSPQADPKDSLEGWVSGALVKGKPDFRNEYIEAVAPMDAADRNTINAIHRIVANLCIYLTTCKAPEQPKHKAKTGRPMSEWRPRTVGSEVKLPPEMRAAAKAFAESGHDRKTWRIHSRFTVRGHWRDQACGPKRVDRRRTWIEPFWKGPKLGVELERVYHAMAHGEDIDNPSVSG